MQYGPLQSQPTEPTQPAWQLRMQRDRNPYLAFRTHLWSIIMITKNIVVSIALCLSAASAFAQSAEFTAPDAGFKSMKSRAQVMAEVRSMPGAKDGVYPMMTPRSTMSREQVRGNVAPTAATQNDASSLYFG
jgi:hypothetical protein